MTYTKVKIVQEWPKGTEQAKREQKIRDAFDIVLLWLKSGEWKKECGTALDAKAMELLKLVDPRKPTTVAATRAAKAEFQAALGGEQ